MFSFEKLHRALMLRGRLQGSKSPQVSALAGGWIPLAGIETVLSGLELPDHGVQFMQPTWWSQLPGPRQIVPPRSCFGRSGVLGAKWPPLRPPDGPLIAAPLSRLWTACPRAFHWRGALSRNRVAHGAGPLLTPCLSLAEAI